MNGIILVLRNFSNVIDIVGGDGSSSSSMMNNIHARYIVTNRGMHAMYDSKDTTIRDHQQQYTRSVSSSKKNTTIHEIYLQKEHNNTRCVGSHCCSDKVIIR